MIIIIDGNGIFTESKDNLANNWRTYLIWKLAQCNINPERYRLLCNNIRGYYIK